MKDKKLMAKKAALMGMSSKLKDETRSPMKEALDAKKKMKVSVIAPDEESLEKGLSKAQELLRAKFGELGLEEDEMGDLEEDYEDGMCPHCGDSLEDMHEHEEDDDEDELE